MITSNQDIFNTPDNNKTAICVTTNGIVKNNGCAVMGAGVAKQACYKIPGIDKTLGQLLTNTKQNKVFELYKYPNGKLVFSFPTKHNWKDKSNIDLILKSAKEIKQFADKYKLEKIYIPCPGCGYGGLNWNDIKYKLETILPENKFIICFK